MTVRKATRNGAHYTHPVFLAPSGESSSSKRISRSVGYNGRIHGPTFPVTRSFYHVNTTQCRHCLFEREGTDR